MSIQISREVLMLIQSHAERSYPNEGAGFLLGEDRSERAVLDVIGEPNAREECAQRRRYLLIPDDYQKAEQEAERRGLGLIGVFHSHPDHPNVPSEFDRQWAQPYFSYVITAVDAGKVSGSRAWRLLEDRSNFVEETILLTK